MTRRLVPLAVALAMVVSGGAAPAYQGRTHAGLTERAALASTLHRLLTERLGRPLGLYEPLALVHRAIEDPLLRTRLAALDPAGGYAPDAHEEATALGWLTSGAVLEGVPAARNGNHFFDPKTGVGLTGGGFGAALRTRVADVSQGIGTVRGVLTGSSFGGSGRAAPAWIFAPRSVNDWGLERFLDERERSAAAPTSAERDDALARALLAAGSIVHVLEDMGDPGNVRAERSLASARAAYDRAVDAAFGRLAVPPPAGPAPVATHLLALFSAPGGSGLADRTYREAGLAWGKDARADQVTAARLLPEIGAYATAAIELLFRGQLGVEASARSLTAVAHELALGPGEISIYADNAQHLRKRLATRELHGAPDGALLLSTDRPDWAEHATAIFRGVDASGEPIVIVQEQSLK